MANKPIPSAIAQRAIDALRQHGSEAAAARALEMPRQTLQKHIAAARKRGMRPTPREPFTVHRPPDAMRPVETLVDERKARFAHLKKSLDSSKLVTVSVNIDGPVAISHFGDPHLDDDGTDIAKILDHVAIVKRTPGLFAANIGDGINAWVGRLARLYGEQSTSESEAVQLYEMFLKELSKDMLYCLGGNHLAWHSGMGVALHRWILANCQSLFDNSSVRIELKFPNGKRVRVNARHDFRGTSQWNTAHGPAKAAQMGWRDHLLTCGHLHTSGYQVLKDPATGLISHALRVSSYKTFDRYAHEMGLPNQDIFCNAVTVIDPRWPDDDPRLVHVCFDVEQGADYLTWLRSRKS